MPARTDQPGHTGLMEADDEAVARLSALLEVRVGHLISRRIPVRGVSAGPLTGSSRLRFADGTTFLVRSEHGGDLARVLHAVTTGRSVLIERQERRPGGLAIWLTLQATVRRLHLGVIVLGPDQPD